ncbi:CoA transferase [Peptoniphilus sp. GNH]|nr:III protein, CoA-transferase family [Clostridiales bacterium KA00134]UHR03221.1 CoA transferase [Peptoniphilus sp. GNH]
MSRQALEGLKVLEVGNIIAGPWCGSMLADFGATVIKVENPKTGDLMRNMGRIKNLWYAVEGRNKHNITLNLKSEKGKEILWKLIEKADVLIENFRPGVFEKLGFTWEKIHQKNRRLIYTTASGYGRTGPYAHRPGFDRMGLALGGFLHVTGYPDSAPVKPGISVADFYTAMFSCMAVMFAIYDRDVNNSGEGQMIDCALTESVLRLQESIIAEYSYDGTIRNRIGNATMVTTPAGHFLTKDNKYLAISITGDKLFSECMNKIGKPELVNLEKYKTGPDRTAHRDEINGIFAEWAANKTLDEAISILGDEIPATPIYDVSDIMKDPQFQLRNDIIEVDTDDFGKIKMQNVVPKMLGTPGKINWAGKPLGYFNKNILMDVLDYSESDLDELSKEGVI